MIWHYHKGMHMNFSAILEETMIKDQRPGFFRKHKFLASAEADEIGSTVFFDMGEISSIESAHDRPVYSFKIVDRSRPRLRGRFLGTQARAPAVHDYLLNYSYFHPLT